VHWLDRLLLGYGERPRYLLFSGATVVSFFTFLYMLLWSAVDLSLAGLGTFLECFGNAPHFSGVSFTALGYGDWTVLLQVGSAAWAW
jgi:hypothetical protein